MTLSKEDIRAALDEGAKAAASGTRDECPASDVLADAAAGRLDASGRLSVAAHIAVCADCAEEYRLAEALRPWVDVAASTLQPLAPRAVPTPRRIRWRAYALAASVVLAIGGAAAWFYQRAPRPATTNQATELQSLRQQLTDASRRAAEYEGQIAELRQRVDLLQPQLNVAVIDLEPDDVARGAPSTGKAVDVPAGATLLTLILTSSTSRTFSNYAVEVIDRSGTPIWSDVGLKKGRYDTFTIGLPRRLLPDGRYGIRTFGVDGPRREPLDEYVVELRSKVS